MRKSTLMQMLHPEMAGATSFISSVSLHSPPRFLPQPQSLIIEPPQFLCCNSILKLRKRIVPSPLKFRVCRNPRIRSRPLVFAAQSTFLKVLQRAWTVGKDGIEAATNLVPDSVPRPVARISTTVVALTLVLFVLKSLLSTVFFVLATMGLVYFVFIALNKDEGPRGGGGETTSVDDSLEEARRIMDKYK